MMDLTPHLTAITPFAKPRDRAAIEAAITLCLFAHEAAADGRPADAEVAMRVCFGIVQNALGPHDERLRPFLACLVDLAYAQGHAVRARALQRRVDAMPVEGRAR